MGVTTINSGVGGSGIQISSTAIIEFRTGLEVTSLVTTVLFWQAEILFESWVVFADVYLVLYFPVFSMLWLLFWALFRAWRRTATYA